MQAPDYYGYEPVVTLRRPLVLTGHPGGDLREAAYDLAALTGLAVHDLDHRIAHEVGQSTWQLRCEQGVEAYLHRASSLAPSLLDSAPAGLIVIAAGVLEADGQLATLIGARAELVFLRVELAAIYWYLRGTKGADPTCVAVGPIYPKHPDDLAPLLAASLTIQAAADLVLDVVPGQVHATVSVLQSEIAAHGWSLPR